jgi:DNA polymerase-1
MPDDLRPQIPLIYRVLEALNIPAVSHPRFEADDVLATLARAGSARGFDVFVCTSDKDCRQLIDGRVRLFNLRRQKEFGRDELMADWGVKPEQVVDLQTLVGDPVDNVPGVPGVGVKTAAKLLQQYGTLEELLQNLDKVSGVKTRENIKAAIPEFELGRKLVRLADDVPVEMTWDAWRLAEPDAAKATALFEEFGFRSLAAEFRGAVRPGAPAQAELFSEADNGDAAFPFGANAPAEEGGVAWYDGYRLVDDADKFEDFYRQLKEKTRFAFDLETTSLHPHEAQVVGVAVAWAPGEAYYLALRGPEGSALLDSKKTLKRLQKIWEDPKVAKVNQNIKYDMLVLRAHGIEVRGVAGDSMVADYLLNAGERSHNLEELSRKYLHHPVIPIEDLIGKKGKKQPQLSMDQVPVARVAKYAAEDADAAWRLCERLEPQLSEAGELRKLYDELEVPLIEVLAELQFNGIRLDVPLLRKLADEMGRQLERIEKEIYDLVGGPFSIGSLPQLRKVLFEDLKLPPQGKTATGAYSTDQEVLEKLANSREPGWEVPRKILEHRQVAKLKGTYVDALPELVHRRTGRVHASFNQTVAATGRLSSSEPNLQHIPVRREQGREIRSAFLPEPGWSLLTADYSQIELRLLAHFCDDPALQKAFAEDRDVHSAVASQIFGVEEKIVTSEMRRAAKTVNFGVIYGISGFGLAQRLFGDTKKDHLAEADRFIDAYFARYPKVLEYQSRLLEACRQTGYVGTILGRRRRIDGVRERTTYQQRNQPEREAINMEIQGSAADLIKLAMLNLHRRLKREKWKSRMLLQIHDELVFEAPADELQELAGVVREEMTTPLEKRLALRTPLKVDLAAGPNWLDVEEVAGEAHAGGPPIK